MKLEPETVLRPPTILEAQSADKHLWPVVSDLVQAKSWSLDQALHELAYVRRDMSSWLQARRKGDRVPDQQWDLPGKAGKKGKSPKGGKGKSGTKWITEAFGRRKTSSVMHALSDKSMHISSLQVSPCLRNAYFRRGGLRTETSSDAAQEYTSLTRGASRNLRIFNRCELNFALIYSFRVTTGASGSTIIAASCIVDFSFRNSDLK